MLDLEDIASLTCLMHYKLGQIRFIIDFKADTLLIRCGSAGGFICKNQIQTQTSAL